MLAIVLVAAGANAQQKAQAKEKRVHFGLKAGMNFSGLDGEGIQSSMQQGIDAGAFAEVRLSKKWEFAPELYYSMHSLKRTSDFQSRYYELQALPSSDEKIKLHYISLPLLMRYHISNVIAIEAGPQYNLLAYEDDNLLKESKPAFKKSEIAVAAGATLTLEKFRIYGRYMLGLSDINGIESTKGYTWKSRQLQIGIGVQIF
ncbi:hypothetical protein GCM10011379_44540 [Filimonas zeae]|uniref:Outer membrane protein beta-barrel domain-containing protein n=2 Tax=Filimonas zeae TaxID=1737353 RepID=A0A917J2D6_9BACT|nr:hypothetical protein GCM10011379_44540 [Filimonas zeae]